MKHFLRQRLILDKVSDGTAVTIEELVAATGASPSTVRRDLRTLEESGQIVGLRGGAVRLDDRPTELPAAAKSLINPEQKSAIARVAAENVHDGDTIYLDSGTTATRMVQFLRGTRVHIVTSNTQILTSNLSSKMTITVLGGEYLSEIGSVAGAMTDRMLSELFFDKAFIGANGISKSAGVTTFDVREASKKRLAHEHSRKTFVLVDGSKFEQVALCRALDLAETTIITDTYSDLLEAANSYIVAESDLTSGKQVSHAK